MNSFTNKSELKYVPTEQQPIIKTEYNLMQTNFELLNNYLNQLYQHIPFNVKKTYLYFGLVFEKDNQVYIKIIDIFEVERFMIYMYNNQNNGYCLISLDCVLMMYGTLWKRQLCKSILEPLKHIRQLLSITNNSSKCEQKNLTKTINCF